jgi:hypothetical protein
MRQGGTGRDANWGYPDIVSGPEGYVGVFWSDNRFYTGDVANELMMRYSIDPLTVPRLLLPNSINFQLLPNYPNPFNQSTVLEFEALSRGIYTVTLTDASGRILFLNPYDLATPQRVVIPYTGSSLPSGSYFISVTDGNQRLSRMINLVK